MSKFAIVAVVLWAATFFVSARAGSYDVFLERSLYDHINYAETAIGNRLKELHDLISIVDSEPKEESYDIIEEFKRNITNNLELARVFIADIIDNSTSSSNEIKCRSFFIDFEQTAQNVINNLHSSVSIAHNATLVEIRKAISVASEALEKLNYLRTQANACQSYSCSKIDINVGIALTDVFHKTTSVLCSDQKLVKELKIRKVVHCGTQYKDYQKKAIDLIQKTLECVYPSDHHTL